MCDPHKHGQYQKRKKEKSLFLKKGGFGTLITKRTSAVDDVTLKWFMSSWGKPMNYGPQVGRTTEVGWPWCRNDWSPDSSSSRAFSVSHLGKILVFLQVYFGNSFTDVNRNHSLKFCNPGLRVRLPPTFVLALLYIFPCKIICSIRSLVTWLRNSNFHVFIVIRIMNLFSLSILFAAYEILSIFLYDYISKASHSLIQKAYHLSSHNFDLCPDYWIRFSCSSFNFIGD